MSSIQCHFDYVCCIWYKSLNKVLKNKLQTSQNKFIRFVLDLKSRAHISKEHFELLNWLPVNSRVDHFIPQDGVHTYNTRLSGKGKITWS